MTESRASGPLVSFVVPCYKHGHFLVDCVESILSQTYSNFEILVMDDCSPDDTPVIARSFVDLRVRHIRNEVNLGHLANYNKGISLAKGEYIWLINVDDYLRRPYVLERFVTVMEATPGAAYVFCPAVAVCGGIEEPPHAVNGSVDRVFAGADFLKRLLVRNCVATPAVMVRKTSYDRVGMFPPDMPHAGDWFQWCRHTLLSGDVAYLAEPMVCYRIHDSNMSTYYLENPATLIAEEMRVRWRIKQMAEASGLTSVMQAALDGIAGDYGTRVRLRLTEGWKRGMTFEEFERSVREHCQDAGEIARITRHVLRSVADGYYQCGDTRVARRYYRRVLQQTPLDIATWTKYVLLALGPAGRTLRNAAARVRTAAPAS